MYMYIHIDREICNYIELEKLVLKYVMLIHILTIYGYQYYFENTPATNGYGIFTQSNVYNYLCLIMYKKRHNFEIEI